MSDRQTSNWSSRPSSETSLPASIAYRTANPYEIGVAYIDGEPLRPLGEVESEPMVFNQPDPDRLRPYIEAFLREDITLRGRLTGGGGGWGAVINVLPQLTGYLVARNVKISYSAGRDLADIAFWNGFRIDRDVSNWPGERGRRLLFIRARGLTIRLERLHGRFEVWTRSDGQAPDVVRDLKDMREVLSLIREAVENYQRPRRARWAVVPTDQYLSIQLL